MFDYLALFRIALPGVVWLDSLVQPAKLCMEKCIHNTDARHRRVPGYHGRPSLVLQGWVGGEPALVGSELKVLPEFAFSVASPVCQDSEFASLTGKKTDIKS